MTEIDPKQAAAALDDIEQIVRRVRQSRIYHVASQIMIASGALVLAGNVANFIAPRQAGYIWIGINVLNATVAAVLVALGGGQAGVRKFDPRILVAFLLFYAFGILCSVVFGHFGPREMGAFWPIYFMFFYCLAGLWFGGAFIAIGLALIALTLAGYVFVEGAAFLLWMAAVNGGGLILSGLWMRKA
jgi:hypothetical protein